MKKFKILNIVLAVLICFNLLIMTDCSYAVKKSDGIDEKEVEKLEENIDSLVKKIYSSSLYSPQDAEKLVDVQIMLNSLMGTNLNDPSYARLFYDAGYICKKREYVEEAIQYFTLVNERFPNSAYAKRAENELKKLGIAVGAEEEESSY